MCFRKSIAGPEYRLSPIPGEGISNEYGQVKAVLSHGYSLLFFLPSKRRLSCQNVGLGPDWSFEWIFTTLISGTANRQSSKGSTENRGGRGVKEALGSLYLDSAVWRWWISALGLMAR